MVIPLQEVSFCKKYIFINSFIASFLAEEICKHFHLMGKGCMVTADNKTNVNMGEAYNEDNHEEADTMIIYHVIHASKSCNRIVVQCSDTDVFVGLIAYASQIDSECLMQVAPDKIYNIKAISASSSSSSSSSSNNLFKIEKWK